MNKRQKKQVLVDPELYNKVKGKCVSEGTTFSNWLERKMLDEVKEPSLVDKVRKMIE